MVEWKRLGEVCEIGTGSNNREDSCDNGLYPFFVRSQEVLRINTYLYDEEAILIPGEGGIGDIFHYIHGKYGLHQRTYRVHPISDDLEGRYIYYFLFANFKTYINAKSYKSTAASIRKPMLLEFPIAIPSLSEQERIVGILDTFTSAIDNLKAQIAQRRKQYEFYRDQLLDLEGKEGVRMKTLGEVVKKISSGKNKSKNTVGKYPVFGSTGIIAYSDIFVYNKPLILVARVGANAGYVHLSYGKYDVTDNTLIVDVLDEKSQKYIFYFLVKEKLNKYAKGGGQPLITATILKDIVVPIPSLSVQQRIVSILDTFEASIANLEAQLKQREKQYEYYRNKLLTFDKI